MAWQLDITTTTDSHKLGFETEEEARTGLAEVEDSIGKVGTIRIADQLVLDARTLVSARVYETSIGIA